MGDSNSREEELLHEVNRLKSQLEQFENEHDDLEELKIKADRLDLALSVANDGIYDWDVPSNDIFYDSRYYTMAGYEPYEFPGTFEEWAKRVHPEDLENLMPVVNAYMSGEIPVYDQEFRFKRKDDSWMWIRARVKITDRDEEGNPLRVVGTHSDITDRKNAEEQLHHVQKMDAIGQLAGGVAHDFNNMLGAINVSTDLLQNLLNDCQRGTELLSIIKKAVANSATLNQQLLTFSRKGTAHKTVFDLHKSVDHMILLLQRSIDKRITIECDLQAEHHNSYGDASHVENAILNVCLNARDAMPDGGVIKISSCLLSAEDQIIKQSVFDLKDPNYLAVHIQDTGIGMDEETMQHVFEPFFTTKSLNKGTGLGLASVYGTMLDIAGAIEVESAVGEGTTFTLIFPLSHESLKEVKVKTAKHRRSNACVLLVEDEELLRSVHAIAIESMGYTCLLAEDGVSCMDMYQQHRDEIDIILLDLIMPNKGGFDCLQELNAMQADVPVVILSGYMQDMTVNQLIDAGAKAVLHKPIGEQELAEAVAQFL